MQGISARRRFSQARHHSPGNPGKATSRGRLCSEAGQRGRRAEAECTRPERNKGAEGGTWFPCDCPARARGARLLRRSGGEIFRAVRLGGRLGPRQNSGGPARAFDGAGQQAAVVGGQRLGPAVSKRRGEGSPQRGAVRHRGVGGLLVAARGSAAAGSASNNENGGLLVSIHAIFGLPGHGKSTFAAYLIGLLQGIHKKKRTGKKFYANFPVFVGGVTLVQNWGECQELGNAVVFVDEAGRWFGRRSWNQNTEDELQAWKQSRKHGNTLYYIAHDRSHVETHISEHLTEKFWYVRRLMGPGVDDGPSLIEEWLGWWAIAKCYSADEWLRGGLKKRPMQTIRFRIDRHTEKFDSFYVVGAKKGHGSQGRYRPVSDFPDHPLGTPTAYGLRREVLLDGHVTLRAAEDVGRDLVIVRAAAAGGDGLAPDRLAAGRIVRAATVPPVAGSGGRS